MEAKLNIYADCTSEKPTKTYTCRRLLLKVSKKVGELVDGMEQKTPEEQEAITIDVIKTIFPDFRDEEYEYIDPVEWLEFVREIGRETAQIQHQALKN